MILKFDEFINEAWMERSHYETQHLYGTDPHFKRQVDNCELHFAEGADGKPMEVVKGEVFYGKISINNHFKNVGKDELPIFIDCITDNPESISCVINVKELAQLFKEKEIRWYYVTQYCKYGGSYHIRSTNLGKPEFSHEDERLIKIKKPQLRKLHLIDDVKAMINDKKEPPIFVKVVVDDVDGKKLKFSVVDAFNTKSEAEEDMMETLKK